MHLPDFAARRTSPAVKEGEPVIDFDHLHSKYAPDPLQRGSGAAILQAVEQIGPLHYVRRQVQTMDYSFSNCGTKRFPSLK